MSTNSTETKPLGLFASIMAIIRSASNTLVTAADAMDDTVGLYHNEIKMLGTLQQVRVAEIAKENEDLLASMDTDK